MDLKDFMAFYGAGLSTVLAVMKALEYRPTVYIGPAPEAVEDSALVPIVNPSKWPLQISGQYSYSSLSGSFHVVPEGFGSDGLPARVIEDLLSGFWSIYIPPSASHSVKISKITTGLKTSVRFQWHRRGSMPRLPIRVTIDAERIRRMNNGVVAAKD